MTKLRATTTPTDYTRCLRSMAAWLQGDRYALDVVLQEVMDDATGVPGLLFELLECATSACEELDPDILDHLRDTLARCEAPS